MITRKPFGTSFLAAPGTLALLISLAPFARAQQNSAPPPSQQQQPQASANFVGIWDLHMQGRRGGRGRGGQGQPGQNGAPPPSNNGANNGDNNGSGDNGNAAPNGGNGDGGRHARQTLTIAADGPYVQITHSTPEGDITSSVMPSGNSLSWTEDRKDPEGRTAKITFNATVTGGSMNGTISGPRGRVQRTFTATREQQ